MVTASWNPEGNHFLERPSGIHAPSSVLACLHELAEALEVWSLPCVAKLGFKESELRWNSTDTVPYAGGISQRFPPQPMKHLQASRVVLH